MARYISEVKLKWAMVVDIDRSFEKACGVKKITLNNVTQMRVISPEGKLGFVAINSIDSKLKGATWKIKGTIPKSLKPLWRAIEFGQYQIASKALKKLKHKKLSPADQEVVDKFRAALDKDIEEIATTAAAQMESSDFWGAYKGYEKIFLSYGSYCDKEKVKAFKIAQKKCKKDKRVRLELAARKSLKKLKKKFAAAGKDPAKIKKADKSLKKFRRKYADTDAAQKAQAEGLK